MPSAASQSLFARRRDPIGVFVAASIGAHVGFMFLFALASHAFGSKLIDLDQKPIHASLVRKGTPRDEKLLPRKEEPPPPPKKEEGAVAPPVPTERPSAPPAPGVRPTEKSTVKKPGEKDGQDRRKQLFGAFNRTGKASRPEERAGQQDGDPNGDSDVQEGERYFGLLSAQVRRHYDVSDTIPEQDRVRLSAVVFIRLGKAGDVLEVKLAQASGNSLYDAAVVAAVKKAAPFSPPPEHLRATMADGANFKFTP